MIGFSKELVIDFGFYSVVKIISMIQKIDSFVSVKLVFNCQERKVFPEEIIWNKRVYPIVKLELHHTFKKGKVLYHVFSVASEALFFKLILNTEILFWCLEQIADEY